MNKELIIIHVVRFLCCFSYVRIRGGTAVVYWAGLCASESELCKFFSDSYNIILTREAAFSRSDMNTLHKTALNSFLLHLFATKIKTNKSLIMCEYIHLFESWEQTICKQNSSSFFAVFFGIFFRHTWGPLPWQIQATFYAQSTATIAQSSANQGHCLPR